MAITTKTNKIVILGTPQAISQATTWSEFSAVSITQCYASSSITNIEGEEIEEVRHCAESRVAMNPRTGTQYDFQDPTIGTTAFEKDETYDDISRSYQTQTALAEFESTFQGTALSKDQLTVASTAFQLDQLGYSVYVVVLQSEVNLLHFVQARNWSYKLLQNTKKG